MFKDFIINLGQLGAGPFIPSGWLTRICFTLIGLPYPVLACVRIGCGRQSHYRGDY